MQSNKISCFNFFFRRDPLSRTKVPLSGEAGSFKDPLSRDDDEMLREEDTKMIEWKTATDAVKAWLKMNDKERTASTAASKKWVSEWVSERDVSK